MKRKSIFIKQDISNLISTVGNNKLRQVFGRLWAVTGFKQQGPDDRKRKGKLI